MAASALGSFFSSVGELKLKGDSKVQYIIFKGCKFPFEACQLLPAVGTLPRSVKQVSLTRCSLDLAEELLQGLLSHHSRLKVAK